VAVYAPQSQRLAGKTGPARPPTISLGGVKEKYVSEFMKRPTKLRAVIGTGMFLGKVLLIDWLGELGLNLIRIKRLAYTFLFGVPLG
jgi:hypothetical protein